MLSQEAMDDAEHWFCLPVVMLINFALFQYLCALYFQRRKEIRIALLLTCAFLGFATLIPQAHPRGVMVGHLNDISETCSTLTFLIQIIVIGRDIERKVKISSLKLLTFTAELLTLANLVVILLNFMEVFAPNLDISMFDGLDNAMENVSLFFIFFFRFFFIAMSRGTKWMLNNKKLEMVLYLLFITHEYPFVLLEELTGVSWEPVQAMWNRLTLLMCILMTIKGKLSSSKRGKSKEGASTAAFSKGPSFGPPGLGAGTGDDDEDDDEDLGSKALKGSKSRATSLFKIRPAGSTAGPQATTGKPTKPGKFGKKNGGSSGSTAVSSSSRISTMLRSGVFSMRNLSLSRSTGPGQVMAISPGPAKSPGR